MFLAGRRRDIPLGREEFPLGGGARRDASPAAAGRYARQDEALLSPLVRPLIFR